MGIDINSLPTKVQRQIAKQLLEEKGEKIPKRSKYGNVRTEGFASKHEAQVVKELHLERKAGKYIAVAEQVPFNIGGGREYIADAVVFYPDKTYKVIDAKSEPTRTDLYKLKKALMRDKHGIEIKEM